MPEELSLTAIRRRLTANPGSRPRRDAAETSDSDDAGAEDPAGLEEADLPSWVPEGAPAGPMGWLASARADPGRAGGVALAAVAVLAVLITVFTLVRDRPPPVAAVDLPPVRPPAASQELTPPPGKSSAPTELVVSVVGLVAQPGLVTVAPDARVADAVAAAGGAVRGADTVGLNLARHLSDGEQIVVGLAVPAGQPRSVGSAVQAGAATPAAPPSAPPGQPAAPPPTAGPVDLNTATVEQLDALPGVGPVTAAAIIAWRQANGRFTEIDQLAEVDGIGPARLEKLRPLVSV